MPNMDFGGAFLRSAGAAQEQQIQSDRAPLERQHLQATTRASQAYADATEFRVQSEKNLSEIMKGMTLDPKASGSATMMQLAGAALKAGDSTTGRELIMRAAQTRAAEAREQESAVRAKTAEVTSHIKMAEWYGRALQGVNSQQDLDAVNQMFAQQFGEQPPAMRYDPQGIAALREGSIKMADKLRKEHDDAMEKIAKMRIEESRQYHQESIGIRRAAEQRRAEHERRMGKEGGKDVGAPSKEEISAATDAITMTGKGEGLDPTAARASAFDLASRARSMRKQNPGLSAGEAMQRALVEQISEGYYVTQKAGGLFSKPKATYGKPGSRAELAIEAPKDPKQRKANTYYKTPKGNLLYLGDGKWQMPEASGGGGGSDDEDYSDEDE